MNVLHVVAEMNPQQGGVCQAVRTIIAGLDELDVHNEVLSLESSEAITHYNDTFTIHALGPSKGPWSYNAAFIPWLIENFTRFDVVIIHGLWLYHGYAVRKARQHFTRQKLPNFQTKVFVMPHGMLDPYFQRATGRKLKAARNWLYWKLVEGYVVNESDGLLFTCLEECHLARKPFSPYQPKSENVVGLGIERPPAYSSGMKKAFLEKCPDVQNHSYIIFLSRIHQKKGVDLLIKAYAQIFKKFIIEKTKQPLTTAYTNILNNKDEMPKLVIAGPGLDTAYGRQMQELVSELGIDSSNILFPGMLTGDSKWGAFYDADVFILPSHQENFGIAIVEALACSKSVLISKEVNIWKEIEVADAGFVANDTIQGTQHLLNSWLLSKDKDSMNHNAYNLYQEKFTIKSVATMLLKAIKS